MTMYMDLIREMKQKETRDMYNDQSTTNSNDE